jgi:hypothetical protein
MSEEKVVMKLLDRITKATGGSIVLPKTRADLGTAAKQISAAMHTK